MSVSRSKRVIASISSAELSGGRSMDEILNRISVLSERETEVFNLLAEGASNRTISARLQITERTAKAHVAQILSKLNVESRMQAGIAAFAWGMLRGPASVSSSCPIRLAVLGQLAVRPLVTPDRGRPVPSQTRGLSCRGKPRRLSGPFLIRRRPA
jgi:DNA-binding CsgD family transcriptional regulator